MGAFMTKVLVVGGTGYIGSHMVKMLGKQGCWVTTLDDLSTGHRESVLCIDFVQGYMADSAVLDAVLSRGFDDVMHFASFIQVGESVQHSAKYYQNNVVKTLALLDAMRAHGVGRFIFFVNSGPQYSPIDERHPQQSINPYGRSKLMVEQVFADYEKAYGLRSVCLR
jgi:UDP-glucose 4-epimerase